MTHSNFTLSTWTRLSSKPAGKWLFSKLVCWKAPYFSSIRPRFRELRPGYCVVTMKKRRAVKNHIGTVHAIAICNLAEIVAGTMTEATVPGNYRWIPKGMTVEYLAKATTDLSAEGVIDATTAYDGSFELPVEICVRDTADQVVLRATVTMWLTPRRPSA
jgi:acyl-coenzyme A thioesterase PaaI-like protein